MNNPYQSPEFVERDEVIAEAIPHSGYDPLAVPATLCMFIGVIGSISFGSFLAFAALEWFEGEPTFDLTLPGFAFAQSLSLFVVARWCLVRRYRWLALLGAIWCLLGCTPLCVILVWQLLRREVWASFVD